MKTCFVWVGAASVVLAVASCGGKVVVENGGSGGGEGGSGASSPTSSGQGASTTVGPTSSATTASGTECTCQTACDKLNGCGFQVDCGSICTLPPDVVQCACSAPGCDFSGCMTSSGQTSSGSSGPTGGSGGSGGGIPDDCAGCVNDQVAGPCSMAEAQCNQSPQCKALLECNDNCNWTNACIDMCSAQIGVGSEFYSLINCAVCGQCYGACQTSTLTNFCLDG